MPNGLILAVAIVSLCAASFAAADTIYVSNEKDNTIAVVDEGTLTTVKTIPVGKHPRGTLLSKDAKSLYICAGDSDHIEVLDLTVDKIIRTLPSGPDPEFFALDPAGKLLYVANEDSNLVTLLDIDRGR
jgi:YVTN family beta-propeller protein